MLEQLLYVLPWSSHRVRAVRAAVWLHPARAHGEASGLLWWGEAGEHGPIGPDARAQGRKAGGTIAVGGGANGERVGDALEATSVMLLHGVCTLVGFSRVWFQARMQHL